MDHVHRFAITFLDDTEYGAAAAYAEKLEANHSGRPYWMELDPDHMKIVLSGERAALAPSAFRLCAHAMENAWQWTAAMARVMPTGEEIAREAEAIFINRSRKP